MAIPRSPSSWRMRFEGGFADGSEPATDHSLKLIGEDTKQRTAHGAAAKAVHFLRCPINPTHPRTREMRGGLAGECAAAEFRDAFRRTSVIPRAENQEGKPRRARRPWLPAIRVP